MTGFFLKEDELIKTIESAGLVPHCPDHSPALPEQDEQGSSRGGNQAELSADHKSGPGVKSNESHPGGDRKPTCRPG